MYRDFYTFSSAAFPNHFLDTLSPYYTNPGIVGKNMHLFFSFCSLISKPLQKEDFQIKKFDLLKTESRHLTYRHV